MGLFLIWKVEASLKSSSSKTPVKYFSGIFQGCYRWYSPKTPAIFLFFASSYRETSQSLHWQTLQNTIVLANLWFQARVWKRDSQIDGMIGPTNLYDPKEQEILNISNWQKYNRPRPRATKLLICIGQMAKIGCSSFGQSPVKRNEWNWTQQMSRLPCQIPRAHKRS